VTPKAYVPKSISQEAFVSNPSASISKATMYVHKNLNRKFFIRKSFTYASTSRTSIRTSFQNSRIICYACHRVGHKFFHYNSLKKNEYSKNRIKRIWVPKGTTSTNLQGPKLAWVPKRTS